MKTASLHDLKSDLKALFINRYLAHGFKLPIILFSGKLFVGGSGRSSHELSVLFHTFLSTDKSPPVVGDAQLCLLRLQGE